MMRTLSAIILAMVVFSCDDNKTAPSDNFISAKKNGVTWTGTTEIMHDENNLDTLMILGIGTEEVLAMRIKFTGTGHYPLQKHQGFYYTTLGGDVLISEYQTNDGNYVGAIVIKAYNEADRTIEGNFEVALKQKWSNPQNGIDAVTFTMGQFKGKIR